MKHKFAIVVFLAAALSSAMAQPIHAQTKVGYIDLQRLVGESEMGRKAQQELSVMREQKEALLGIKLSELNKLKDYINKEGATMDPATKKDKIEELQKAYKDYQRLVADAKDDIEREDRDLVATILNKADGVLKMVAKSQGYTIILKDPNAIGYLDKSVDITDAVLKELNKN